MALGFDDIIIGVEKMAETAAKTTKGIGEIIGDGVEESVGDIKNSYSLKIENSRDGDVGIPKETSNKIPSIEGDGIPEQSSTMELPEEQTNVDDIQSEEDNSQKPFESEDNSALDDNGKPYIKDGELISNNTYEINGVKYETDDKGRIVRAEAKVEINNSPRPSLNNRKVGGLEPGDDKGHVIAHVLGGSDTEGNLVAQDAKLNRGEYKSMELNAKHAREQGKDVAMTVEIEYDGDSKRPRSFSVTLEIDGDITVKKFINNTTNGQYL